MRIFHDDRNFGRISATPLAPMVMVALLALAVVPAESAYYHDLEKNRQPCADCHTLHYSESGAQPTQTEAGGPFSQLLIRATTTKLCLFCHDGYDPKAPDVLTAVSMYAGSGDEHSGAGFFANSGGTANLNGHDLGVNASTVPFSTKTNMTLSCASCHDPHGTLNYRNVLTAPAGGTGVGVEMARDVFRDLPPGNPPATAASIAAYKESNEGYKAQTSKWCTECHDLLQPLVGGTSRGGIGHHLVDFPINGLVGGVLKTDPDHWYDPSTYPGPGFGTTTDDGTEGVPRLRFQVYPGSSVVDWASARIVATNNQVICTTCHLAHGGKYQKGLVWPFKEGGTDYNSGCDQCHNGGP